MKVFVVIGGDHSGFDIDSIWQEHKKAEDRAVILNQKPDSFFVYGIMDFEVK